MSDKSESPDLVNQIIAGQSQAEEELFRRYRYGVPMIINRIVRNPGITEDLTQETFVIVLEKIRRGEVRDPEKLSGFISAVARNHAIEYIRRAKSKAIREDVDQAENLADPSPDPLQQMRDREIQESVREVINELSVERDRQVLFRFFIAEEDKEQICADLNIGSQLFDKIIFRAKGRFKELYIKRKGRP